MTSQEPKTRLLDGQTGWRTCYSSGVAIGRSGLRLASDPCGPLSLGSPDESLGGLAMPRGMALDGEGTLYILSLQAPHIKLFDAARCEFSRLPGVGGDGSEARQLHEPSSIALAGHNLYVVDQGNKRVQVFDTRTLALRHIWKLWGEQGGLTPANSSEAWEPVDVTASAGAAYILDRRYGQVYLHRPGTDHLQPLLRMEGENAKENYWSRVIVDRERRIYLLYSGQPPAQPTTQAQSHLDVYDHWGRSLGQVKDAGQVRDRFESVPVRLEVDIKSGKALFCLPGKLARPCGRQAPSQQASLALCASKPDEGLIFDREGKRQARIAPDEVPNPRLYGSGGEWISEPLDSHIYQCQWHRIVLELGELPAGTQVTVSTYTDSRELAIDTIQKMPGRLWETNYTIMGQMQGAPHSERPASNPPHEFLVQSRLGRYLWLKIEIKSDGYGSPTINSLRIHFPRESYLEYLPAIYQADDESRWFLERFLSIFQTTWDDLEHKIEESATLFDPRAVPAGKALEYLAGLLALPLEGTWDWEQKRRLLAAMPKISDERGTLEGLRKYLRVYLENITGIDIGEAGHSYPQITEGFRERRRLQISEENLATLGQGAPLWGPGVVGRLQLDVYAREGQARLVSTGDPERDLFHEHAHRFTVFVPSSWVRHAEDERMVRRALDTEKPAHTSYKLSLVEARFRVGIQSTVGIDTVLGDYPTARLACRHETSHIPPSRPPRYRLGYDTVLAAAPSAVTGLKLAPGTQIGIGAALL